ncbi:uncharacterized protein LOC124336486 [Daphnia pulicaria]|uniref:uncharacterized protein LOC124336486 n=1 Tax=Daphnia pulicaria TaxID=35523 RepID=UPI001EEA3D33|nr:uncharacterized protein LOC124336486 [Daphnia pulicaria]
MYYLRYFLSLAVVLQLAITAPTPTNFLQPFETYFSSLPPVQRSITSENLRSATGNSDVNKVRSIQNRGGPFNKNRNYFEDFKIPDDFGNNFPEYSETPQSGKGSGDSKTSQGERVHQKNEYYSYSFSTPVEDVSGDDVIAVVNVKHSPKVYFYQVAEAGPRHLKVMYFTGFPTNRQRGTRVSAKTN